jgi:hypothetical protein
LASTGITQRRRETEEPRRIRGFFRICEVGINLRVFDLCRDCNDFIAAENAEDAENVEGSAALEGMS